MTSIDPGDASIPRDSVDKLLDSWGETRPDLDFEAVGVVSRLGRLRGHMDSELKGLFDRYGLSRPVFGVLVTLARLDRSEGVSQRRLMDELGLSSGTISIRMNELAERGLIERSSDEGDRRNILISLTPAGRDLYERVVPAHLENERRLLAALDEGQRAQLSSLLRRLLVEVEGSLPADDEPVRLGLTLAPAHVTLQMRAEVGLPPDAGLLVRSVEEGAPADEAGLRPGQVLRRAGGRDLLAVSDLYAAIAGVGSAGKLKLDLLEGVEALTATIRLGAAGGRSGASASTAGRSARGEHVV